MARKATPLVAKTAKGGWEFAKEHKDEFFSGIATGTKAIASQVPPLLDFIGQGIQRLQKWRQRREFGVGHDVRRLQDETKVAMKDTQKALMQEWDLLKKSLRSKFREPLGVTKGNAILVYFDNLKNDILASTETLETVIMQASNRANDIIANYGSRQTVSLSRRLRQQQKKMKRFFRDLNTVIASAAPAIRSSFNKFQESLRSKLQEKLDATKNSGVLDYFTQLKTDTLAAIEKMKPAIVQAWNSVRGVIKGYDIPGMARKAWDNRKEFFGHVAAGGRSVWRAASPVLTDIKQRIQTPQKKRRRETGIVADIKQFESNALKSTQKAQDTITQEWDKLRESVRSSFNKRLGTSRDNGIIVYLEDLKSEILLSTETVETVIKQASNRANAAIRNYGKYQAVSLFRGTRQLMSRIKGKVIDGARKSLDELQESIRSKNHESLGTTKGNGILVYFTKLKADTLAAIEAMRVAIVQAWIGIKNTIGSFGSIPSDIGSRILPPKETRGRPTAPGQQSPSGDPGLRDPQSREGIAGRILSRAVADTRILLGVSPSRGASSLLPPPRRDLSPRSLQPSDRERSLHILKAARMESTRRSLEAVEAPGRLTAEARDIDRQRAEQLTKEMRRQSSTDLPQVRQQQQQQQQQQQGPRHYLSPEPFKHGDVPYLDVPRASFPANQATTPKALEDAKHSYVAPSLRGRERGVLREETMPAVSPVSREEWKKYEAARRFSPAALQKIQGFMRHGGEMPYPFITVEGELFPIIRPSGYSKSNQREMSLRIYKAQAKRLEPMAGLDSSSMGLDFGRTWKSSYPDNRYDLSMTPTQKKFAARGSKQRETVELILDEQMLDKGWRETQEVLTLRDRFEQSERDKAANRRAKQIKNLPDLITSTALAQPYQTPPNYLRWPPLTPRKREPKSPRLRLLESILLKQRQERLERLDTRELQGEVQAPTRKPYVAKYSPDLDHWLQEPVQRASNLRAWQQSAGAVSARPHDARAYKEGEIPPAAALMTEEEFLASGRPGTWAEHLTQGDGGWVAEKTRNLLAKPKTFKTRRWTEEREKARMATSKPRQLAEEINPLDKWRRLGSKDAEERLDEEQRMYLSPDPFDQPRVFKQQQQEQQQQPRQPDPFDQPRVKPIDLPQDRVQETEMSPRQQAERNILAAQQQAMTLYTGFLKTQKILDQPDKIDARKRRDSRRQQKELNERLDAFMERLPSKINIKESLLPQFPDKGVKPVEKAAEIAEFLRQLSSVGGRLKSPLSTDGGDSLWLNNMSKRISQDIEEKKSLWSQTVGVLEQPYQATQPTSRPRTQAVGSQARFVAVETGLGALRPLAGVLEAAEQRGEKGSREYRGAFRRFYSALKKLSVAKSLSGDELQKAVRSLGPMQVVDFLERKVMAQAVEQPLGAGSQAPAQQVSPRTPGDLGTATMRRLRGLMTEEKTPFPTVMDEYYPGSPEFERGFRSYSIKGRIGRTGQAEFYKISQGPQIGDQPRRLEVLEYGNQGEFRGAIPDDKINAILNSSTFQAGGPVDTITGERLSPQEIHKRFVEKSGLGNESLQGFYVPSLPRDVLAFPAITQGISTDQQLSLRKQIADIDNTLAPLLSVGGQVLAPRAAERSVMESIYADPLIAPLRKKAKEAADPIKRGDLNRQIEKVIADSPDLTAKMTQAREARQLGYTLSREQISGLEEKRERLVQELEMTGQRQEVSKSLSVLLRDLSVDDERRERIVGLQEDERKALIMADAQLLEAGEQYLHREAVERTDTFDRDITNLQGQVALLDEGRRGRPATLALADKLTVRGGMEGRIGSTFQRLRKAQDLLGTRLISEDLKKRQDQQLQELTKEYLDMSEKIDKSHDTKQQGALQARLDRIGSDLKSLRSARARGTSSKATQQEKVREGRELQKTALKEISLHQKDLFDKIEQRTQQDRRDREFLAGTALTPEVLQEQRAEGQALLTMAREALAAEKTGAQMTDRQRLEAQRAVLTGQTLSAIDQMGAGIPALREALSKPREGLADPSSLGLTVGGDTPSYTDTPFWQQQVAPPLYGYLRDQAAQRIETALMQDKDAVTPKASRLRRRLQRQLRALKKAETPHLVEFFGLQPSLDVTEGARYRERVAPVIRDLEKEVAFSKSMFPTATRVEVPEHLSRFEQFASAANRYIDTSLKAQRAISIRGNKASQENKKRLEKEAATSKALYQAQLATLTIDARDGKISQAQLNEFVVFAGKLSKQDETSWKELVKQKRVAQRLFVKKTKELNSIQEKALKRRSQFQKELREEKRNEGSDLLSDFLTQASADQEGIYDFAEKQYEDSRRHLQHTLPKLLHAASDKIQGSLRFANVLAGVANLPIEGWEGKLESIVEEEAFTGLRKIAKQQKEAGRLIDNAQMGVEAALLLGRGDKVKEAVSVRGFLEAASRQKQESGKSLIAFLGKDAKELIARRDVHARRLARPSQAESEADKFLARERELKEYRFIQEEILSRLTANDVIAAARESGAENDLSRATLGEIYHAAEINQTLREAKGIGEGLARSGSLTQEDRTRQARKVASANTLLRDMTTAVKRMIAIDRNLHGAGKTTFQKLGIQELEERILPELTGILQRINKGYGREPKSRAAHGLKDLQAEDYQRLSELAPLAAAIAGQASALSDDASLHRPFDDLRSLSTDLIASSITSPDLDRVRRGEVHSPRDAAALRQMVAVRAGAAFKEVNVEGDMRKIARSDTLGVFDAAIAGGASFISAQEAFADVETLKALNEQSTVDLSIAQNALSKLNTVLRDPGISPEDRKASKETAQNLRKKIRELSVMAKIQETGAVGHVLYGKQTMSEAAEKKRAEIEKKNEAIFSKLFARLSEGTQAIDLGTGSLNNMQGISRELTFEEFMPGKAEELKEYLMQEYRQRQSGLQAFTLTSEASAGDGMPLQTFLGIDPTSVKKLEEKIEAPLRAFRAQGSMEMLLPYYRNIVNDALTSAAEKQGVNISRNKNAWKMFRKGSAMIMERSAREGLGKEQTEKLFKDLVSRVSEFTKDDTKKIQGHTEQVLDAMKNLRRVRQAVEQAGGINSLKGLSRTQDSLLRDYLFLDEEGQERSLSDLDKSKLVDLMSIDESGRAPFNEVRRLVESGALLRKRHSLTNETNKFFRENYRDILEKAYQLPVSSASPAIQSSLGAQADTVKAIRRMEHTANWLKTYDEQIQDYSTRYNLPVLGALLSGAAPSDLTRKDEDLEKFLRQGIEDWQFERKAGDVPAARQRQALESVSQQMIKGGYSREQAASYMRENAGILAKMDSAQLQTVKRTHDDLGRAIKQFASAEQYLRKEIKSIEQLQSKDGLPESAKGLLDDRMKTAVSLRDSMERTGTLLQQQAAGERMPELSQQIGRNIKIMQENMKKLTVHTAQQLIQMDEEVQAAGRKILESMPVSARTSEMQSMVQKEIGIARQKLDGGEGLKHLEYTQRTITQGGTSDDIEGFRKAVEFQERQGQGMGEFMAYRSGTTAQQRRMAQRDIRARRPRRGGGGMIGHYAWDFFGGDLLYSLPAYFGATAAVRSVSEGFQTYGRVAGQERHIAETAAKAGIPDPLNLSKRLQRTMIEDRISLPQDQYLQLASRALEVGVRDEEQLKSLLSGANTITQFTGDDPGSFIDSLAEAIVSADEGAETILSQIVRLGVSPNVRAGLFSAPDQEARAEYMVEVMDRLSGKARLMQDGLQGLMTESSASLGRLAVSIGKDLEPLLSEFIIGTTKISEGLQEIGFEGENATSKILALAAGAGAFTLSVSKGWGLGTLASGLSAGADRLAGGAQAVYGMGAYGSASIRQRVGGVEHFRAQQALQSTEKRLSTLKVQRETFQESIREQPLRLDAESRIKAFKDYKQHGREMLLLQKEQVKQAGRLNRTTLKLGPAAQIGKRAFTAVKGVMSSLVTGGVLAAVAIGIGAIVQRLLDARQAARDFRESLKTFGVKAQELQSNPSALFMDLRPGEQIPEAQVRRATTAEAEMRTYLQPSLKPGSEDSAFADLLYPTLKPGTGNVPGTGGMPVMVPTKDFGAGQAGKGNRLSAFRQDLVNTLQEVAKTEGVENYDADSFMKTYWEDFESRTGLTASPELKTKAGEELQKAQPLVLKQLEAKTLEGLYSPAAGATLESVNEYIAAAAGSDKAKVSFHDLKVDSPQPLRERYHRLGLTPEEFESVAAEALAGGAETIQEVNQAALREFVRPFREAGLGFTSELPWLPESVGGGKEGGVGGVSVTTGPEQDRSLLGLQQQNLGFALVSPLERLRQEQSFALQERGFELRDIEQNKTLTPEQKTQQLALHKKGTELLQAQQARQLSQHVREGSLRSIEERQRMLEYETALPPGDRLGQQIELLEEQLVNQLDEIRSRGLSSAERQRASVLVREETIAKRQELEETALSALFQQDADRAGFGRLQSRIRGEDATELGPGSQLYQDNTKASRALLRQMGEDLGVEFAPLDASVDDLASSFKAAAEAIDAFAAGTKGTKSIAKLLDDKADEIEELSFQRQIEMAATAEDRVDLRTEKVLRETLETIDKEFPTLNDMDFGAAVSIHRENALDEVPWKLLPRRGVNPSDPLSLNSLPEGDGLSYPSAVFDLPADVAEGSFSKGEGSVLVGRELFEDVLRDRIEEAENMREKASSLQDKIKEDIDQLTKDLGGIFSRNVKNSLREVIDGTMSWGEAFRSIWGRILTDVSDRLLDMGVDWVGGAFSSFLGGFLGFGGGRSEGGPVEAGKRYVVGEHGQETFVPLVNGYIIPNESEYTPARARPAVGGGSSSDVNIPLTVNTTVNVTNQGSGGFSEEDGARLRSEMEKEVRRAAEEAALRVIARESRSGGRLTGRIR